MAAKKGKTKTAKVKSLKSRKLDSDQASQVKGGLLPAVNLAVQWKWAPTSLRLSPTDGIAGKI